MDLQTKVVLNDGNEIPVLGYGTYQAKGKDVIDGVFDALQLNYRHIDTAAIYANEVQVGRAIEESEIPREEIFVTTKLWNEVRGYDETKQALEESLQKLNLDYVDLYLIHWPNPLKYRDNWEEMNAQSWRAMEDLVKEGKVKSIGVSNFMIHHLEALFKTATIMPVVNQIRVTPGDTKYDLVKFCLDHKIKIEAYSPLGEGQLINHEVLVALANKYNKSVAQLCLRWSIQQGFIPLPKSVHKERIKENSEIFDFEISHEDMDVMNAIDIEPPYASFNPDYINF